MDKENINKERKKNWRDKCRDSEVMKQQTNNMTRPTKKQWKKTAEDSSVGRHEKDEITVL